MRSIQSRLGLGLGLGLVVVFLAIGVGGSLSIRYLVESYVLTRLEHDTEALLSALHWAGDGAALQVRGGRVGPVYMQAYSGHYFQVDAAEQRLRSRSLWDQDLDVPLVTPGQVRSLRAPGPDDQLLLVRVAGYRKAGRDLSIAVAEDLTPVKERVRGLQARFALLALGVVLVLLALQRVLLTRTLAPLTRTRRELEGLAHGERERLDENVPTEVRPLVAQINRLLGVLRQRLERSRNALGNLAHAMKSPLTLLAQLVERRELDAHPDLRDELRAQVGALRRLMDRELKRARLAGAGGGLGPAAVGPALAGLAQVMERVYADRALDLQISAPEDARFLGDREDLMELLGNLLDNACKWARRRVRVTVVPGDPLVITVADDGPGCSDELLGRLQRRGVRVDESAVPGHGLGLAIARDVAEHYGGELTLGRSAALGGFEAKVTLPGAGAAG